MVDFLRQVSSNFGDNYTGTPTLSSVQAATGDLIVVVYTYRAEGRTVAPPTWNGQAFTPVQARSGVPIASPEGWLHIFFLVAGASGTFNVIGSMSEGESVVVNASALVFSGPVHATPISGVETQSCWETAGWQNPALTLTSVATGDLVVDVLAALHWDVNYVAYPAVTWSVNQSQAGRVSLTNAFNQVGRQIVSTKSGSGSIQVGYQPSANQPGYTYVGFVIKAADAGTVSNPGLRLKVQDRIGATPDNDTNYSVVVRSAINSDSILLSTATAAITDGYIEIDSDSIGAIDDVVYVTIAKQGATIAQDKNASGRAVVVDLETGDES